MIMVMRMLNGEELISEILVSEDASATFMKNPCIIDSRIANDGKVSAQLIPTALFSKDYTVILNEASAMYTSEPTPEILEVYKKKYSAIITPPSQILHG